MSNLYLLLPHKSFVDNMESLFFNYLSNDYSSSNMDSLNYSIYSKILHSLNNSIQIDKNISYTQFKIYLNKYIYNLLNNNINTYIDTCIKDTKFIKNLFTNNDFQYYTNHNNEILRLLSDNNTDVQNTFNISKNYNMYKTKLLNIKKTEKHEQLKIQTINTLKDKLYEIFIVVDGLEKLMYSTYNNLIDYQSTTFNEVLNIIKNSYGITHTNFKNKHNIYFLYTNKTIDYYDIYHDILTYPKLKDKIVIMFIQLNHMKYNERLKELLMYKKYKHILHKIFDEFLYVKEQDEDDEITNLNESQKQTIKKKLLKTMYRKYDDAIGKHFSQKYPIDEKSYDYVNVYNTKVTIPVNFIPIDFVNNINLEQFKQESPSSSSSNIINNKDIIKELVPNIDDKDDTINIQSNRNNNVSQELNNRLKFIKDNKDDIDYINHTINFLNDNFEDDENLTKLKESISFLDLDFINHFNISVLKIKHKYDINNNDIKLLNNIMNDIQSNEDDSKQVISGNSHIIDDYNPLSPIYEINFSINIEDTEYKFKTLLHFIYFNQYLELYKVFVKHSNQSELNIISIHKLAYNLIFKNSILNIFEENKTILSNKTNFKNFNELQTSYYELLHNIRYFIFKLEINNKINDKTNPYFNFIISYANNLNIIYSDKDDNYLGIGKYGNGNNMIGIFMNEYKKYITDNSIFDYDFNDIFLINCNFNKNVHNWLKLKINDLLYTIVNCCMLVKKYEIDIVFINNVFSNMYKEVNTTQNIYYLPIHDTFTKYITQEINNIDSNITISNKSINEIWKMCFIFIHNIFDFQQQIITNSDDFQTFINYYDKHNIEHLLYYTLSLANHDNLEQAMKDYTDTKSTQLQSFYKDDQIDYTIFSKNILFSSMNETSINNHDKSLVFDVNGEQKYINFVKSKLGVPQ